MANETKLIRIPQPNREEGNAKQQPPGNGTSVEPKLMKPVALKSNLQPEAKQMMKGASRSQLIALGVAIPAIAALGYGMTLLGANGEVVNAGDIQQLDKPEIEGIKDFNPGFATSVDDDMTFNEAFAAARAELGPGNVFMWEGSMYGTYLKEEWDSMTDDQKADYFESLPYDQMPTSTTPSTIFEPVIVTPNTDPEEVLVVVETIERDPVTDEMILTPEQELELANFDINELTDEEKIEMALEDKNDDVILNTIGDDDASAAIAPVATEEVVTEDIDLQITTDDGSTVDGGVTDEWTTDDGQSI